MACLGLRLAQPSRLPTMLISVPWLPRLLCLLLLLLPLLLCLLLAAQQVVAEAAAILTQIHQVGKAVHLYAKTERPAGTMGTDANRAKWRSCRAKHMQVMCTPESLQAGSEQGADFPGRPARCSRPHHGSAAGWISRINGGYDAPGAQRAHAVSAAGGRRHG